MKNDREQPCGMTVIHGSRMEALRADLASRLHRDPLPPLENEIILVQSNGMAQWLKAGLAGESRDQREWSSSPGIAAAVEMLLPARFFWRVYRTVLGAEQVPEVSPLERTQLVWRLLRLLPEVAERHPASLVQRFLADDPRMRKRFQLAEELADLFDQYSVFRADWLLRWAQGRDEWSDLRGQVLPLPEEQRWQCTLWRTLLTDLTRSHGQTGTGFIGRAEVHAAFLEQAQKQPERPHGLPGRVSVFGITSLPTQSLHVLLALARWMQVVIHVHNPCQDYWADLLPERVRMRRQKHHPASWSALEYLEYTPQRDHPLLSSWGRQGRDFIGMLEELAGGGFCFADGTDLRIDREELFIEEAEQPGTLLQQLQEDIRTLNPLPEDGAARRPILPRQDPSMRFHVAHSRYREVEILHDQLLAAFQADPALTPRDILVLVPDIDDYVPMIQAVFGLHDPTDSRHVPYTLANRRQLASSSLLQALQRLLDLPGARMTVSDLLGWLDVAAIRRRFAIDEADLPLIRRWIEGAGICWGWHADHRRTLDLPILAESEPPNSWWSGLQRMLAGYAMGDRGGPWAGVDPCDEIDMGSAGLLGSLLRLLDRLEQTWRLMQHPAPVEVWCNRLQALLGHFFAVEETDESFLLLRLEQALEMLQEIVRAAGVTEPVPLELVGNWWLARMEESGLASGFFGGAVTFATLMPMRAIPFRHVAVLGMNDGEFPRLDPIRDFDLMRTHPRPGDRQRRDEDRYLFLEALLSARERLSIFWVGRNIHDQEQMPPSVLVGQLREHLAAGWRLAGLAADDPTAGHKLLDALTVEHRLQPFSSAYFPIDPVSSPFFTYAREWRPDPCAGTRAENSFSLLSDMPWNEPLTVRELASFLKAPVRYFLQRRLRVYLEGETETVMDHEPFQLDSLARWSVRERLLRAQQRVVSSGDEAVVRQRQETLERLRLAARLPEGGFGALVVEELEQPMARLFARYRQAEERWPCRIDAGERIALTLPVAGDSGTVVLDDLLSGMHHSASGERGRILLTASRLFTTDGVRHEKAIEAWIAHLALHLACGPLTTLVLSEDGDVEWRPLAVEEAEGHLMALIAWWQQGLCRPLPLEAGAACLWVSASNDPEQKARKSYEGSGGDFASASGAVHRSAALQRVYPDFDTMLASGEFGTLAETLYGPMVQNATWTPFREAQGA
ncbi:MAG: exodeoxyribonuclease V subunit gamma [Magnetococcales bacterium]|nr:exodeoxyribonuclease V subunit gamma [Magnetococcales bacterium]NGZ05862.1 exodeoxyribonuclease V subunit gamma [Magnetococcales bacterium]